MRKRRVDEVRRKQRRDPAKSVRMAQVPVSGRRRAPKNRRGQDALSRLGQAVRAARLAQGLSEPALSAKARVGERTLRRLQHGEGCQASHLLQVLAALGQELPFAAPPPHSQQVLSAAAEYFGAEWIVGRPTLAAHEAALLARDLAEDLRAGRWHGGAEGQRRELLKKLRRMGPKARPRPPRQR